MASFVLKIGQMMVPKPALGRFGFDFFYLLIIVVLQVAILPTLFGFSGVDLLTPWLVLLFIGLNVTQSMFFALVGALALEGHGVFPAGLYICSYWVLGSLICLVKKHFSWQNTLPWLVCFLVSHIWMIVFESLVFIIQTGDLSYFNFTYFMTVVLRLLSASLIGVLAARMAPVRIAEEKRRESAL